MKRFFSGMIIIITVVLIICGLSACSKSTDAKGTPVENGIISLDGTIVSFGKNNVPDGKSASMKTIKVTKGEKENGLTSELFELTLTEAYTEPLTVTFPVPKNFTGAEGEALLIGLGFDVEYDNGSIGAEYFYVPAELTDQTASISFIPAKLLKAPLYKAASESTAKPGKITTSPSLKLGLFTNVSYFVDGGHFRLYYPMKVDGKFFHSIVGTSGIKDILEDLEKVYNKFIGLGYKFKEKDFPMNVQLKNIEEAGFYHTLFKDITINLNNFKDKYTSGSLNPLLWHEYFHYVQSCYTEKAPGSKWIDEATSSYYEANAKGSTFTSLTAQHFEKQFTGAFPTEDTAHDGYARSPLIAFLALKQGNDSFIKTVYENGGTQEAMKTAAGDPSGWAHEYYTAIATGKVGQMVAFQLHKNLITGVYNADIGTTIKLNIPEANKQAQTDKIMLGSAKVNMNGQGCRLIAITADADELKKLPDGIDPKVECKGASVTVVSAISSKAKVNGKVLTGLKDSADSKAVYLVVVTSESAAGVSGNFEVKVNLELEKIDYSGTYTGVLNVTETGADIDVTTVVTFEKDFGDGAYYKIVCTNDKTNSTYINNSYFVRPTGKVNISDAEFTFSPDGLSFTASMMDFSKKTWGIINAQK